MTYRQALIKAGFKKLSKYRDDIIPYSLGNYAGNMRYAEILIYEGWDEVWLVGKDIKDTGTMSYPGGTRFHDAKELDKYLQTLPPFTTH